MIFLSLFFFYPHLLANNVDSQEKRPVKRENRAAQMRLWRVPVVVAVQVRALTQRTTVAQQR